MKILHVVSSLDPAAGGPPAVAIRLAAAQAMLGHAVSIVSYGNPSQAAAIAASVRSVPGIEKVNRIELPALSRREHLIPMQARRRLSTVVPQFDWVHLHGVWDPILKAAGNAASKHRKPYIICPHGMLDPWSMTQSALKKKLALALGYRRLLDNAAALHVLNADEANLIAPLHLKPPAVVIPNGVFLEELQLPSTARSTCLPLSRSYILFLGRLHTKKGLDILADAFAIVARQQVDLDLVVAGPDGNGSEDFDRRIGETQLQSRVHRIGAIYGEDKLIAYRDALCFCLPSHQEGFSLAVAEAMAMAVPVIITPGVHFPEVQTAGAGYVVQPSADHIAAAILRLNHDEPARLAMGRNARKLIESTYTWPRIAKRSVDMYELIHAAM